MAHRHELSENSYWLTRFIILWWLCCIYGIGFLAAALQLVPLIGSDGILPIDSFLEVITTIHGSKLAGFLAVPSLFWFHHSDVALQIVSRMGFDLSCLVAAGYANFLHYTIHDLLLCRNRSDWRICFAPNGRGLF